MDSKEFGLVAAQQLFQVEDLHYGFWYEGEEATLGNWQEAQKAHTKFLFKHIFAHKIIILVFISNHDHEATSKGG